MAIGQVRNPWFLRYASHLGYRSPELPLFHAGAADDAVSQIEYTAGLGLSGVQYANAVARSIDEQYAVGAALRRAGLATGCMLYATRDVIRSPHLGRQGSSVRERFLKDLRAAVAVSKRIRSTQIVILAAADPRIRRADQLEALVGHLGHAADLAESAGVVLLLECLISPALPPMVLDHLDAGVEAVRRVARKQVRLIFDTAHAQNLEGDAASAFSRVHEDVELIQLADWPDRVEPGAGEIDFESILAEAAQRGYSGLFELEHGWSTDGPEGERAGLRRLRQLDARVRRRVAEGSSG